MKMSNSGELILGLSSVAAGHFKDVTFKLIPDRSVGVKLRHMEGMRDTARRWNSICKDPEVGKGFSYLQNRKNADIA